MEEEPQSPGFPPHYPHLDRTAGDPNLSHSLATSKCVLTATREGDGGRVKEEDRRRRRVRKGGRGWGEERRRLVLTDSCRTETRRRGAVCALQELFLFLALISIK